MAKNIFLINPVRKIQKNEHLSADDLKEREVFFNFGLFSIHQYLSLKNIEAEFVDCQSVSFEGYFFNRLNNENLCCISVISAFNGPHVAEIIDEIKSKNNGNIIVLGGQHYIGQLGESAFKIFPGSDIVISGEGEEAVWLISIQWKEHGSNLSKWDLDKLPQNCLLNIENTIYRGAKEYRVLNLKNIDSYDYCNYPSFGSIFPVIEYSRGCPYRCSFCANTKLNRIHYRTREILSVSKSLIKMKNQYGREPLKLYVQASNFSISHENAELFHRELEELVDLIEWRTEMRVDTYQPGILRKLYKCGLRIVDLGIDSADYNTLKLMNKCSNPNQYLLKASLLMNEANDVGIFCKVNMLVHPGDTSKSLEGNERWLRENQHLISAVSISPTLLFPGSDLDTNFDYYQECFGTRKVEGGELAYYGVYEIDPSNEIDNKRAKEYSLNISRILNRKEKYAYSKSFGYHRIIDTKENLLVKLPSSTVDKTVPYSN